MSSFLLLIIAAKVEIKIEYKLYMIQYKEKVAIWQLFRVLYESRLLDDCKNWILHEVFL